MCAERAAGEQGFSLVEVLVALVMTAFLLAIAMNGAVAAKERGLIADQKGEAVRLANSLVVRAADAPYRPGVTTGREGRLEWELSESPAAADPTGQFILAALRIAVKDKAGRTLFSAGTRRLKALPLQ